jgi:hypothetical protein
MYQFHAHINDHEMRTVQILLLLLFVIEVVRAFGPTSEPAKFAVKQSVDSCDGRCDADSCFCDQHPCWCKPYYYDYATSDWAIALLIVFIFLFFLVVLVCCVYPLDRSQQAMNNVAFTACDLPLD